ncbi:MAG TPA: hypothetical protein VF270_04670 [Ignavibacteriaceae bacterium]|jgi:hypothetical protein
MNKDKNQKKDNKKKALLSIKEKRAIKKMKKESQKLSEKLN